MEAGRSSTSTCFGRIVCSDLGEIIVRLLRRSTVSLKNSPFTKPTTTRERHVQLWRRHQGFTSSSRSGDPLTRPASNQPAATVRTTAFGTLEGNTSRCSFLGIGCKLKSIATSRRFVVNELNKVSDLKRVVSVLLELEVALFQRFYCS